MFNSILRYGILSQAVSGATPFSPDQISGLTAWYGDDVNGGVDRSTLSDGAAITQWDDKSGNDYHALDDGNAPTYNTSRDAIVFSDSTDTRLIYTGTRFLDADPKFTNFIVLTSYLLNTTQFVQTFGNTNLSGRLMEIGRLGFISGDYFGLTFRGGDRVYYWDGNGDAFQDNVKYLITSSKGNGSLNDTHKYRINGSEGTLKESGTTVSYNLTDNYYIGGWYDDTRHLNGEIQEIITYNRALSASEIQQVETWLNNKYSIY